MSGRKAARPANHKVRKSRASVSSSSAKSRRRQATSTTTPTQEHAAAQRPARQLRSRTAEDIANEQTAEQIALRIWAATVGEKVLKDMSALMDELLQSHLLDDDDEEGAEIEHLFEGLVRPGRSLPSHNPVCCGMAAIRTDLFAAVWQQSELAILLLYNLISAEKHVIRC
jgi:hypothetical protein